MSDEGEDVPVAAVAAGFGLPEELAVVLSADPFEQLDVARKIISIALASCVVRLEAEAAGLRAQLAQRDDAAEDLCESVEQLESALALATDCLSRAEDDKEMLLKEKATLSNTLNKLNRDVAKLEARMLEVFKKTLMQSLQEDDANPTLLPRQSSPKLRVSPLHHLLETMIHHFQLLNHHSCLKLQVLLQRKVAMLSQMVKVQSWVGSHEGEVRHLITGLTKTTTGCSGLKQQVLWRLME